MTVNVTTTYDFGEFYVVVTEAGVGIVAAFILYFLVAMFVTFLLEHAAVVAGILLLWYAINRGSEVRKYYYDLPKFFMVTGALVAITVLINAIFFFIGGPTAVPDFLYVVDLLIAAIEVINIIALQPKPIATTDTKQTQATKQVVTQLCCNSSVHRHNRTTAYKT